MIPKPGVPSWVRKTVFRLLSWVPERVLAKALPSGSRFAASDIPAAVVAPSTETRLLVGPVNSAGQAWQWARAAERNIRDVGAVSMMRVLDDAFGFAVDYAVPLSVYRWSRSWQKGQERAVGQQFTHVIVESGKRLFGDIFPGSARGEIERLRRSGIRVAVLFHGSDIRLPSRHAAENPWSPFQDDLWDSTPALETIAKANALLLDGIDVPVFVSTPDLLDHVDGATWLPVVVDPGAWAAETPPFAHAGLPRVAHVPSKAVVKGSDLVDPVLARLEAEGLLQYVRIHGVPSADMPAIYRSVDIVLDQFRLGSYGVAACEAMAAGRIVVSHVTERVRDYVKVHTGMTLPIVEATGDTLEEKLREIIENPEGWRAVARSGVDYVRSVHDGTLSADALRPFLEVSNVEKR